MMQSKWTKTLDDAVKICLLIMIAQQKQAGR